MSNAAPQPQDLADGSPDASVVLAESRLRMLRRLAEIGMELAERTLNTETAAAEKGRDPADSFARLSRAIRLTLILEAKTEAELRDLRAGVVRVREEERIRTAERHEAAATKEAQERAVKVRELVAEAAEFEIADAYEFAGRYVALHERLDEDPAYEDLSGRPLRETVERLCKDLMLTPDWSRWDGEGWIKQEGAPKRHRYSIFNQPSAVPLLDDDDIPEEAEAEPRPGHLQNGHDLE
jgi:hypothetical protein